jgi:hypothetical protein
LPDRLQGGIICLALFQSQEPLGVAVLDELDLLHVHLNIVEFFSADNKPRIHAHIAERQRLEQTGTDGGLESWERGRCCIRYRAICCCSTATVTGPALVEKGVMNYQYPALDP